MSQSLLIKSLNLWQLRFSRAKSVGLTFLKMLWMTSEGRLKKSTTIIPKKQRTVTEQPGGYLAVVGQMKASS